MADVVCTQVGEIRTGGYDDYVRVADIDASPGSFIRQNSEGDELNQFMRYSTKTYRASRFDWDAVAREAFKNWPVGMGPAKPEPKKMKITTKQMKRIVAKMRSRYEIKKDLEGDWVAAFNRKEHSLGYDTRVKRVMEARVKEQVRIKLPVVLGAIEILEEWLGAEIEEQSCGECGSSITIEL